MSSMSNNGCVDVSKDSFVAARRAWPERGHDDRLSAPVRRVFNSWMAVSEANRLTALDAGSPRGLRAAPGQGFATGSVSGPDVVRFPPPGGALERAPAYGRASSGHGRPRDHPSESGPELRRLGGGAIGPAAGPEDHPGRDPGRGGRCRRRGRGAFAIRPSQGRPRAGLYGGVVITKFITVTAGVRGNGQEGGRFAAADRSTRRAHSAAV